jgi:hypothetical protein
MKRHNPTPTTKPTSSENSEPKKEPTTVVNNTTVHVHQAPPQPKDAADRAKAYEFVFNQQGWGPGLGQNLDAGDKLTFTFGAETHTPIPYHSFTCGPFSHVATVRKGEGIEDIAKRAYQVLAQLFEADFEIKKKQVLDRVAEVGAAVDEERERTRPMPGPGKASS